MKILELMQLEVSSEMDVFNGLVRYFNSRTISDENKQIETKEEDKENVKNINSISTKRDLIKLNEEDQSNLDDAIKKIRFLSMTANEFAEGPAQARVLKESEIFEIMFALSKPNFVPNSYPRGFTTSTLQRDKFFDSQLTKCPFVKTKTCKEVCNKYGNQTPTCRNCGSTSLAAIW